MESRALAQKVQRSNYVSPPIPTAVNKVRLTCADSGCVVDERLSIVAPRVFSPTTPRIRISRVFTPRSRVSALLIVARGRGTKCAWLIVVDTERARPRDAGTENGQPFSICAVSRRTSGHISATGMPMTRNRANRKTAEGQRVGGPLPPPQSDSVGNNSKRASICFFIAKQTSQHPPSPNL